MSGLSLDRPTAVAVRVEPLFRDDCPAYRGGPCIARGLRDCRPVGPAVIVGGDCQHGRGEVIRFEEVGECRSASCSGRVASMRWPG